MVNKPNTESNAPLTAPENPPIAKKEPKVLELHGVRRVDNYYWLRDDERKAKPVIEYLQAENDYAAKAFSQLGGLEKDLFDELANRLEKNDASVPYLWRGNWYGQVYEADSEYPKFVRSETQDGPQQVILNVNDRAKGHEFYSLGRISISPNQSLLAFSEDTLSRRIYKVYIKNLVTGELLSDTLEGVDGALVWANDNQHLFYIVKDPQTLLGNKVYRHRLGTQQTDDVLVYEELDDSYYLALGKSLDESRIALFQNNTTTSQVSYLNADKPTSDFVPVLTREEGHEYSAAKLGDEVYILTNWQAPNFRVMKVALDKSQNKANWQEVIPASANTRYEDMLLLKDYLVVQSRTQGVSHIHVHGLNQEANYSLEFNDPAYVVGLDVNREQNSDKLRLYYSSPTTPESIFEYQLAKPNQRTLLKQEKVLGGFDSDNYQSERLMLPARDDVKVPVTLVYRKDKFKADGTNPLYIYGYGAYGYTVEADFDSSVLSLLDRGFVYAIAHVRGGEMLGRPWYDAGRMEHKHHSFDDFVDVTRALVERKYGDKSSVFAAGGSAGGLLMGAVINQAPELYLGVAAHVPFVDIVTTMLDESIPLTTNEYDEWGNPNKAKDFHNMLSYSPYDQIGAQTYPNLLVTTGLHDSQVQYFEPAKWVAKLREYKTDDNLLLFYTDMDAGHGGKSGRYRQFEDTAREYAFFLGLLGKTDSGQH